MLIPALLLMLSVLAMAVGWQTQGADTNLLFLLGLFSTLAAVVLLLRTALAGLPAVRKAKPWVVKELNEVNTDKLNKGLRIKSTGSTGAACPRWRRNKQ